MSHRLNLLFKPDPALSTARAGGNVRRDAGSSGSWCVSPSPSSHSPSPAEPGWEKSPLHPPQHLRVLRLPEPLGKQGEPESGSARGENMLKGIFFLFNKSWWFQVTSGWFWVAGRGSFSLSPKSVTQPGSAQVVGLCFSVIHAAGLVRANICWQTWLGTGFPPFLYLSPRFCSPCGPPVPVVGWHYGSLILFLLLFFLSFVSFSPTLNLLKGVNTRRICPKIKRGRGKSKQTLILDCGLDTWKGTSTFVYLLALRPGDFLMGIQMAVWAVQLTPCQRLF